jgi:hypothetical protein
MEEKSKKIGEHMFSIELKSKQYLKNIILTNAGTGNVVIEGFLGQLETLSFTEDIIFEINGSKGSLRMDLNQKELKRLLPKKTTSEHKKQI